MPHRWLAPSPLARLLLLLALATPLVLFLDRGDASSAIAAAPTPVLEASSPFGTFIESLSGVSFRLDRHAGARRPSQPATASNLDPARGDPRSGAEGPRELRGQAIRHGDGAPLGHFRFQVFTAGEGEPRSWTVLTDADGRFALEVPRVETVVSLLVEAGEPSPLLRYSRWSGELLDGDGLWVVPFEDFTEVRLRLTGLEGPQSEWTARFATPGERRPRTATAVKFDEEGPFVRLAHTWFEANEPALLAVTDEAGFAFGSTEFVFDPAVTELALGVHLRATGAIRTTFELDGSSGARGVDRVRLRLSGTGQTVNDESWRWRSAAGRWLEPGTYRVHVLTGRHLEDTREVEVLAGGATEVGGSLQPRPRPRKVRGMARTRDGSPLEFLHLLVSAEDSPEVTHRVFGGGGWSAPYSDSNSLVHVEPTDPSRGVFELPEVYAGDLHVVSVGNGTSFEVRTAASGAVEAEIEVIQDSVGSGGIGFRLAEEAPVGRGGRPDRPQLDFQTLGRRGAPRRFGRACAGALVASLDPLVDSFEWAVQRRGMRPVFGDESAFVFDRPGHAFAEVEFEPGFGCRVLAHDRNGMPVEGARVEVDGESIGTTDAAGAFDVKLDAAPFTLEVSRAGFETDDRWRPDPEGGSSSPWFEVRFRAIE